MGKKDSHLIIFKKRWAGPFIGRDTEVELQRVNTKVDYHPSQLFYEAHY